jgi:hypothetical protein
MLAHRNSWTACRSFARAAGLALAALATAAMTAPGAASGPPGLRMVRYGGYAFQVPAGWLVINLAGHPEQCVRFDRHVVYLGVPGPDQACPSVIVGTTEALLIQPSAARATAESVQNQADRLITVVTRRITVTATYGSDPGLIEGILASASLPAPAPVSRGPVSQGPVSQRPVSQGPVPPLPVRPGGSAGAAGPALVPAGATDYTGQGFDTCTAPSLATMRTLRQYSPYRAVGVYIGGSDRGCAQQNLTAQWVTAVAAAGWHFIPLYVGPQAGFGEIVSPASQAVGAAQDAAAQARLLGFGPGTPLYYDMEAFSAGQAAGAVTFMSSWTVELHALGYLSGIYSSSLSGIADLVNNYANPAVAMPDVINDALWNGAADTLDPTIPATSWPGHLRIHQYSGGVVQKFGDVSLSLDQDYLDVQLATAGGTAEPSQAAADQASGVVNVFFRGSDGALWHSWFGPGTGWHGPRSFGGSVAGEPSVVAPAAQAVAVCYKGADGDLWYAAYTPGLGWSALQDRGMGPLGSGPFAVAQDNGVIDVFWQGSLDDHLWHARYTPGSGWYGPQNLGGSLSSVPSVTVSSNSTVSVFWRGTDGHLWYTAQRAGLGWQQPASLGMGQLGGPPDAAGQPDGTIDVYWNGIGGASLWHALYAPGPGWSSHSQLTTGVASAPFAVTSAAGTATVFWMGANGGLWWAGRQGGAWRAPVSLPMGMLGSAPFAAGQSSGTIDVFWRAAVTPGLWRARYSGSWSGPFDLGGSAG